MSGIGVINWRNNTGTGWAGSHTKVSRAGSYFLDAGTVVIKNARPLHAGLCKGSSDIIGITSVEITEEMVGQTIGVFTAVEVKRSKSCKPTINQKHFLKVVKNAGGYAGVATCEDDVKAIVRYP